MSIILANATDIASNKRELPQHRLEILFCQSDNVYMKRTRLTIKQENVFIHKFQTVSEARNIGIYQIYNYCRLHENLGYKTPDDMYNGKANGREFVYAQLTKARAANSLFLGPNFRGRYTAFSNSWPKFSCKTVTNMLCIIRLWKG